MQSKIIKLSFIVLVGICLFSNNNWYYGRRGNLVIWSDVFTTISATK